MMMTMVFLGICATVFIFIIYEILNLVSIPNEESGDEEEERLEIIKSMTRQHLR